MEITTEMVVYLLMFVLGIIVGIYIITQTNQEQDKKLLTNLLKLERNIGEYKDITNRLRIDLRLAETKLKVIEAQKSVEV